MSVSIPFDTIEDAIADIKNGKIIIVVDDENRENEGDFIAAAECVTPEMICQFYQPIPGVCFMGQSLCWYWH